MGLILSRKRQLRVIFVITIVYVIIQIPVVFSDDAALSRQLWIGQKDASGQIQSDRHADSGPAPVLQMISDDHFWVFRAGLLVTIILAVYYRERDKEKYILFRNISLSAVMILIIASGVITWVLKIAVGRPRPYTGMTECNPLAFSTRLQSFPSGHATETFSYLMPYLYFIKRYDIKIFLFLCGLIISSLRVILSYHFITDVIFGIYITMITGYIICSYFDEKSKNMDKCA